MSVSLSAIGQQITVGGSVNVTLPSGYTSLTQASALTALQQKFPSFAYPQYLVSSNANYVYYNLNGNILMLSYQQVDGRGTYLANQKLRHDAAGSEDGINARIKYTSSITTLVNNISILLTYNSGGGVSTYSFTCCNPYNRDILIGTLHFADADKATLTTMLNTLFSSIYFIPRNVTFTMSNSATSAVIVTFVNGPSNLSVTLQPGTVNLTNQVLSGLYSVLTIRPAIPGSTVTRTMTLGTRPPVTAPGNAFSNAIIAPGSSDLTLTVK